MTRRLIGRQGANLFYPLALAVTSVVGVFTLGALVSVLAGSPVSLGALLGAWFALAFTWWGVFGMPYPARYNPQERRVRALEREAARQERLAELLEREAAAQQRLEAAFARQLNREA